MTPALTVYVVTTKDLILVLVLIVVILINLVRFGIQVFERRSKKQ
jgi:hypothetical protein